MAEKKIALDVEQNTGQQPFADDGQTQNIQRTGDSENFGVTANKAETSQEQQDKMLQLLQAEAAGPSYTQDSPQNSFQMNHALGAVPFVAVFIVLFMVYLRFFRRKLSRNISPR